MQQFDTGHRRVSPGRESIGSDLFTVIRYDPLHHTCDLTPYGINQRGVLTQVPVACGFGGSWEMQKLNNPPIGDVDPTQYGNVKRGPRWGVNYPIQAGDLCRVMYVAESQHDPVITEFYRQPGDFGLSWVANQVLSQDNDYTRNTPVEDDEPEGRFDLLLPSGGWLRCSNKSSWVVATAPVDRPKAYASLHSDGVIKLKARDQQDYVIHLEFDPNKKEGRICVGSLEDGAYIELKDGNITLKASGTINLFGKRVDGHIKPPNTPATDALMGGGGGLLDLGLAVAGSGALGPQGMIAASVLQGGFPATPTTQPQLATAVAQSMGEQIINGGFMAAPSKPGVVIVKPNKKGLLSNLLSNPAIDGLVRGQIGDLLSDPQGLMNHVIENLVPDSPAAAIAGQLVGVLGASALTGDLSEIASKLDLRNIAKQIGVPSWVAELVTTGLELPDLSLPEVITRLSGLTDNALLSEVMQWAGSFALNGDVATAAISGLDILVNQLPNDLKTRVKALLEVIDETPVRTPTADNGQVDWHKATAQRLGSYLLQGNTTLGGTASLFPNLDSLLADKIGEDAMGLVRSVAGQIEEYFSNPHALIEQIPEIVLQHLPDIVKLPPEIRDILSKVTPGAIGRFSQAIKGVVNPAPTPTEADGVVFEPEGEGPNDAGLLPAMGRDDTDGVSGLLEILPEEAKLLLQALPDELFTALENLLPDELKSIFTNPLGVLNADTELLSTVFGQGFSQSAGTWDVRVQKLAKFQRSPQPAAPLQEIATTDEFHLQTFAEPIEVYQEYGVLELPDYFA